MAHQFNLCSESFAPKRQVFGARAMVLTLSVLLVVGGVTAGAWRWNLEQLRLVYQQQTEQQARELTQLKAVVEQARVRTGPADPALTGQLQERRNALAQREVLLAAVREGMFKPGEGHSDRLRMLADSIPQPVWITSAKAEFGRMEVAGYTLESAALNEWVSRLATHALMRDLKLSTVVVENKTTALVHAASQATSSAVRSGVPLWSFNLVNVEPAPVVPAAPSVAPNQGAKP
jgi:Tfp pilus assembly protein PilN